MIPKKIHYCWFGRGEKPKLAEKCIRSWKKYCPDYEIIEWNEDNFDINMNGYTRYCYDNQKWAFLSDYARLAVIYEHGGIYFDTDVEVIRSFDDLLQNKAFAGFEDDAHVNSGLGFGAEHHNEAIRLMLVEYDTYLDGSRGTEGCPILNTSALERIGLVRDGNYQELSDITVYPKEYFNPYDDPTGKLNSTVNTYSIHWYAKSWMSRAQILRSIITRPFHRIFGVDVFYRNNK